MSDQDDLLAQLQEANAAIDEGAIDQAIELLTQVLVESRRAGEPGIQASACGTLAQALAIAGRHEESLAYAHRGLAIVEEIQPEAAAQFNELIAALESAAEHGAAALGDPQAAIAELEARASDAEAKGDAVAEGSARLALAQVLAGTGQPFLAGIQLRAALAIAERLGDENGAAQIRATLQTIEAAS